MKQLNLVKFSHNLIISNFELLDDYSSIIAENYIDFIYTVIQCFGFCYFTLLHIASYLQLLTQKPSSYFYTKLFWQWLMCVCVNLHQAFCVGCIFLEIIKTAFTG